MRHVFAGLMVVGVLAGCGMMDEGIARAPVAVQSRALEAGKVVSVEADRSMVVVRDRKGEMQIELKRGGSVVVSDRRGSLKMALRDLRPGMPVKFRLTGMVFETLPPIYEADLIEIQTLR